jgi:hypothetical protein
MAFWRWCSRVVAAAAISGLHDATLKSTSSQEILMNTPSAVCLSLSHACLRSKNPVLPS